MRAYQKIESNTENTKFIVVSSKGEEIETLTEEDASGYIAEVGVEKALARLMVSISAWDESLKDGIHSDLCDLYKKIERVHKKR